MAFLPITESEFRKNIKTSVEQGYFFFGEEDYLKLNAVSLLRDAVVDDESLLPFNFIKLDHATYTPEALEAALLPPPMLGERKLVMLSISPADMKRAEEVETLVSLISELRDYADYNVLLLNIPAGGLGPTDPKNLKKGLFPRLSEYLIPVRFDRVTPARLSGWAGKHFEHNRVRASGEVCARLVAYCGTDMFVLASEIDKLCWYLLEQGRDEARPEDIPYVCCESDEYDTFALSNAILNRDYATAFSVLGVKKAKREEPMLVLGEVTRKLGDIYLVGELARAGMTNKEIAAELKMNEYPVSLCRNAASRIGARELSAILCASAEADRLAKTGARDYIAVERLIFSL